MEAADGNTHKNRNKGVCPLLALYAFLMSVVTEDASGVTNVNCYSFYINCWLPDEQQRVAINRTDQRMCLIDQPLSYKALLPMNLDPFLVYFTCQSISREKEDLRSKHTITGR